MNELSEFSEEYRNMMVILLSSLVSCITSVSLGFAMMVGCFVHVQRNNELKVKELMESTNGIKERLAASPVRLC
jgi:hypothetical protein